MANLTTALQAALFFVQLATFIHGMDMGGHDVRTSSNHNARDNVMWSQDGRMNGNEMTQDEAFADILKVSPWAFYTNQAKPTFTRESRNSASFQSRPERDEEIQFTETSRSPPFAPRLGRVVHYSPRLRRITLN